MPKGQRWSEAFKAEVRAAYLLLPRTSGKWKRYDKMKRGVRVKNGQMKSFLKKWKVCERTLLKWVHDLQPWNKGRTR